MDAGYHRRPHSSLMGKSPRKVFRAGLAPLSPPLTPRRLAEALETTVHRTVRRDCTFSLDGVIYEVAGAHLARRRVSVVVDGLTEKPLRVYWKETPVAFGVCDASANRHRSRGTPSPVETLTTPFDPIAALLAKAREVGSE